MSRLVSGGREVVLEGVVPSRLASEDARLGTLTAIERYAGVEVNGQRALEGPLVFQLSACTPIQVPGVVNGSCQGGGTFQAQGRLSRGKSSPLLIVGDEARCTGVCLVQSGTAVIPYAATCNLRIERSGQASSMVGARSSTSIRDFSAANSAKEALNRSSSGTGPKTEQSETLTSQQAWPGSPSGGAAVPTHRSGFAEQALVTQNRIEKGLQELERSLKRIERGLLRKLRQAREKLETFRERWTAWVQRLPPGVDLGDLGRLIREVDRLLQRATMILEACEAAIRQAAEAVCKKLVELREESSKEVFSWFDGAATELDQLDGSERGLRDLLARLPRSEVDARREFRKQKRKIQRDRSLGASVREEALQKLEQILVKPFFEQPPRARERLRELAALRVRLRDKLADRIERGVAALLSPGNLETFQAQYQGRAEEAVLRAKNLLAGADHLFHSAAHRSSP